MQIEHIFKYFQGNGLNLDKQTGHRLLSKTANLIDKHEFSNNLYK